MLRTESTRTAFMNSLIELTQQNSDVVLVCADSTKVVKADPFIEKYPDRIFDMGISEQNMVASAAGMASCGLIPYVRCISWLKC